MGGAETEFCCQPLRGGLEVSCTYSSGGPAETESTWGTASWQEMSDLSKVKRQLEMSPTVQETKRWKAGGGGGGRERGAREAGEREGKIHLDCGLPVPFNPFIKFGYRVDNANFSKVVAGGRI